MFGEVDIDSSLTASHSSVAEEIVMVNNGCMCCTVRGDLVKMLLELVKKKRDKFDHIVIETTSLAKPSPVIGTFFGDEILSKYVKLDGFVTLIDFKHVDLVSDEELSALNTRIKVKFLISATFFAKHSLHGINSMAQIKQAKFGVVDMDFVLGVGGYDIDSSVTIIEYEVKVDKPQCSSHQPDSHHEYHGGHHHHDHVHDSAVTSVSIVCEGNLDLDELDPVEISGEDRTRGIDVVAGFGKICGGDGSSGRNREN
ncbi:hypothetical protein MKX03_016118 [Papaver bracteatum]|nr:hypothetical protein MKX03_016118 [Papaver bracteatum]